MLGNDQTEAPSPEVEDASSGEVGDSVLLCQMLFCANVEINLFFNPIFNLCLGYNHKKP